jgi:hypothetical protein
MDFHLPWLPEPKIEEEIGGKNIYTFAKSARTKTAIKLKLLYKYTLNQSFAKTARNDCYKRARNTYTLFPLSISVLLLCEYYCRSVLVYEKTAKRSTFTVV